MPLCTRTAATLSVAALSWYRHADYGGAITGVYGG
jgi:hypothetical protein